MALPPAILSRFDLVHVMIDEPDAVHDRRVAEHIVAVHQRRDAAITPDFSTLQLQKYIKFARTFKPQVCRGRCIASWPFLHMPLGIAYGQCYEHDGMQASARCYKQAKAVPLHTRPRSLVIAPWSLDYDCMQADDGAFTKATCGSLRVAASRGRCPRLPLGIPDHSATARGSREVV